MKTKNARIVSTSLGYEDHGIMVCWLHLDYGDSQQAFGGYAMGVSMTKEDRSSGYGIVFIKRILDTVGVDEWEQLPGKHVRVVAEDNLIKGIGNILEDKWFYPADLANEFKTK